MMQTKSAAAPFNSLIAPLGENIWADDLDSARYSGSVAAMDSAIPGGKCCVRDMVLRQRWTGDKRVRVLGKGGSV